MVLEEFLKQSGEEKYKEALRLHDVESKNDPEADPYKSRYKAREILQELKQEVEKLAGTEGSLTNIATIAVLHQKLGGNYIACEESATGEEYLNKCVDAMLEHRLKPECCGILFGGYNELGVLWAGRSNNEKALEFLGKGETLYMNYKDSVGNSPLMEGEYFKLKQQDDDEGELVQKRSDVFEDKYTHTMYYLAQVYGNLEQTQKSAEYCQGTLRRQLDCRKYEPVDWALNAATLSQYYITQRNYTQARHCLASAQQILQELGDPPENLGVPPSETESQEDLSAREKIPKAWADLYRCWIKYGISLLEYSQSKLYEKLEKDFANFEVGGKEQVEEEDVKNDAKGFNLELTAIESKITDKTIFKFDVAREVFLASQRWLKSAQEFYLLDGYCTDHIELIQDHSKLFKLLAGFESDFDRQSKMHKRRVDMLSSILKELNSQHYLLICRQLMYELAETYSYMLDVKLAAIEDQESPPSQHAKGKINQLATQSLEQYQNYMDSLKNKDKVLPNKFTEDDERPALVAMFCMGRLHSKYLEFDPPKYLANVKKSFDCYKYLVDYCKRNPESESKIKSEKDICEEMVELLPTKMDRIRAQTASIY